MNYNLVINSKFRPFSYDEMIKPVNALYEAHTKVEEGLAELQAKSGMWERLANEQSDPDTYRQYKAYADDLANAAADLALNGINASSRQGLYNMKARYATDITPIEKAYERRQTLADEQRKLNAQNNWSLRFDRDFSTVSLDELIKNPELSYLGLNGESIAKRTQNMITNLAKNITSEPKYKKIMDSQYWQSAQQAGYSPKEIVAMAQNDPNAPEELKFIRKTIHDSVRNNPAYDEAWVDSWMAEGAFSGGAGGTTYGVTQNRAYIDPEARQRMSIALAQHNATMSSLQPYQVEVQNDDGKISTIMYDPVQKHTFRTDEKGNRIYTPDNDAVMFPYQGLMPVVDNASNFTGSYFNPKTKRYEDGAGNITGTPETNAFKNADITPLFFDAWSAGTNVGYQTKTRDDGNNDEYVEIPFSEIRGEKARQSIMKAIGRFYNNTAIGRITDDNVRAALAKHVVIERDLDNLSDNHFRVTLRGVGENAEKPGTYEVQNTTDYNKALSGITNVLEAAGIIEASPKRGTKATPKQGSTSSVDNKEPAS